MNWKAHPQYKTPEIIGGFPYGLNCVLRGFSPKAIKWLGLLVIGVF